jgi:hypothetical protein
VARLLTRLTTFDAQVPQGAPTSTAIANMLLALPVDRPVSARAAGLSNRYTRFVDDLTLSGSDPRPLINTVAKMLSRRRLPMHRAKVNDSRPKLRITPNSRPQEVTGLLVNSKSGASVSRQRRDKIRAAIFALRGSDRNGLQSAVNSTRGRIAYVRIFNPGAASRLERYLGLSLARSG